MRKPPPAAPANEVPIQPVESPILCSPYAEPTAHWVYIRETGEATRNGGRRPAGFFSTGYRAEREQASLPGTETEEETREDLQIVNRLRQDVKRWREAGYRGATPITRDLLAHWTRAECERPLFFCQREAVETVIWLLELQLPGRSPWRTHEVRADDLDVLNDQELLRLACKMATGSGKTVVMAMTIAWSLLNHLRLPTDERFAGAVLVCCPNLTIKERLQVLRPEAADNYFARFNLVPTKLPPVPPGRVLVNNWHQFGLESENAEGGATYRVVQKGEESPEAFSRRLLGNLADHGQLLVLNDEGHHAWRPRPAEVEDSFLPPVKAGTAAPPPVLVADDEEVEEATVWVAGLERFAQGVGVRAVVDLSATPFYIGGSGWPEGKPFPWIVSDFGLVDAIESGIVKIPRLPVSDVTGRPEPKFYRLWHNITAKLPPSKFIGGKKGRPKPEAVYENAEDALTTLASQWKQRFETFQAAKPGQEIVPPVMIVVCADTNLAQHLFERISGERQDEVVEDAGGGKTRKSTTTVYDEGLQGFPELWNRAGAKRTMRIDSRLLAQAESADGGGRQQAAEELRRVVSTVGKVGEPGEQIRCVVAVSMLNEGWDANNVTHVLGLRAFGSQLLCEQVVGRALRRMDYAVNPETKLLEPEYADIYGIPFTLIPFKGRSSKETPDVLLNHVKAVDARAAYEMRFPYVEGYTYTLSGNVVACDVAACERTVIQPEELPTMVSVGADFIFGDKPLGSSAMLPEDQDRGAFWDSLHFQQIEFAIARELVGRLTASPGYEADADGRLRLQARRDLFPQVLGIVRRYIDERVDFRGWRREELALAVYVKRVVELLQQAIRPVDQSGEATIMPILNRWKPIGSTAEVSFKTKRPCHPALRSHLDQVVLDTGTWERSAAFFLEASPLVAWYARNDEQGPALTIPYAFDDESHVYLPDFIVRLNDAWESVLLLEIKGREYAVTPVKHQAAKRWRDAVNNLRGWHDRLPRHWRFWANFDVQKLGHELARLVEVKPGDEDALQGEPPKGGSLF